MTIQSPTVSFLWPSAVPAGSSGSRSRSNLFPESDYSGPPAEPAQTTNTMSADRAEHSGRWHTWFRRRFGPWRWIWLKRPSDISLPGHSSSARLARRDKPRLCGRPRPRTSAAAGAGNFEVLAEVARASRFSALLSRGAIFGVRRWSHRFRLGLCRLRPRFSGRSGAGACVFEAALGTLADGSGRLRRARIDRWSRILGRQLASMASQGSSRRRSKSRLPVFDSAAAPR